MGVSYAQTLLNQEPSLLADYVSSAFRGRQERVPANASIGAYLLPYGVHCHWHEAVKTWAVPLVAKSVCLCNQ